jgi:hypothetical protein
MNLVMSLVGTVESVLCFPSRCGNPRCERISISGVSFHKASVSFFFAPFFFLCAYPQFSTEKFRARSGLGTTIANSVDP